MKDNKARFIIAGISQDKSVLAEFRQANFEVLDIALPHNRQYQNLPCDDHPNALANTLYAEVLYNYLVQSQ